MLHSECLVAKIGLGTAETKHSDVRFLTDSREGTVSLEGAVMAQLWQEWRDESAASDEK